MFPDIEHLDSGHFCVAIVQVLILRKLERWVAHHLCRDNTFSEASPPPPPGGALRIQKNRQGHGLMPESNGRHD